MRAFPITYLQAAGGCLSLLTGTTAYADFFKDSHASLMANNYYMNSDFQDETTSAAHQQSKRVEWAQGFTLNIKSGFTQGPVGFGLDVMGMLGLKIAANDDETGNGILSVNQAAEGGRAGYVKKANDDYSKVGFTAKARYAATDVRVGTLIPNLPVVQANLTRLFPQTFLGGEVVSRDIENLTVTVGQINQVKQRDSTDFQKMTVDNRNGRFAVTGDSDRFYYGGADYAFSPSWVGTYYYSELQDFYRQQYMGLKYSTKIGGGKFGAEARYFNTEDSGARYAGKVDNNAYTGIINYAVGTHKFSAGYTVFTGDTAIAVINGAGTYLPGEVMINNFAENGEHVASLRYDYDFSALGLPGLTLMTRYLKGTQAELGTMPAAGKRHEYERDTDVAYAFAKGSALENFAVLLRNGTARSNFQRDIDQTRLIVSYTMPLY
ncbi:OprD family outer membrane porin [Pseudomonas sp. MWU16-30317]|uniref:OprD family outer membrane porin n=1 Tax=Pseudomonas sp. MWU16-30317 TaxID=2878095 RepID=UPI001CFA3179|nr:OprD family outer membrane porin [Pseudomonas sp. MWU16-30317]